MIILSGAAGQIGSALARKLNEKGFKELILIDSLEDGKKIHNLKDIEFVDYIDYKDFRTNFLRPDKKIPNVSTFFHLGACSSTSEWNGEYLMDNNFNYSKEVLKWCSKSKVKFIYASSASVYGNKSTNFKEEISNEEPINAYAFSKYAFDMYVRANVDKFNLQVIGLRYFNVYGSGEFHKGDMASPIFQFNRQLTETGKIKLFGDYGDIKSEDISRDFVHADDCAAINIWFQENSTSSGIFNVGTGTSTSFHDVAKKIIELNNAGTIEMIEFPQKFTHSYQYYTKADLSSLRKVGCNHDFMSLDDGIKQSLSFYQEVL